MRWAILMLAISQDPPIDRLIEQLGHDDASVREASEKELAEIGAPALEKLRRAAESDDPEIRERADRILKAVELQVKFAQVYSPPPPLTVSGTRTVREALSLIGSDIAPRDVLDLPVTLDLKDATPFDLLDSVCRQVDSLRYVVEDGRLRFLREPFLAAPSFSSEAFRVRLAKVDSFATTDFTRKRYAWSIQLQPEVFPTAKTFGTPLLSVHHVEDDRGRRARRSDDLFIVGLDESGPMKKWADSIRMQGSMSRAAANRVFTFVGQEPTAHLSVVRGIATFFFRIDAQDLRLEIGRPATITEFTVTATASGRGVRGEMLQLTVLAGRDSAWLQGVLSDVVDRASIVAVDPSGNEHKLEPFTQTHNGDWAYATNVKGRIGIAGHVLLGTLKATEIREIRVKASGVYRKEVPFEIRSVPLP